MSIIDPDVHFLREAADEIERLRAALAFAKAHLETNDDPVMAASAALDVLRSAASVCEGKDHE